MAANVIAAHEGTIGAVRWASLARPLDGQRVCGDAHVAVATEDGALLAVIDGLGHGEEAAEAARAAVATLEATPSRPVEEAILACHRALGRTRGAVMSVVRVHAGAISWAGVGNVEAIVVRGPVAHASRARLLLSAGVVGQSVPTPRASRTSLFPGDLLVLGTDGLGADFTEHIEVTASPQRVVDTLLSRCRTGRDDTLALAARYDGSLR